MARSCKLRQLQAGLGGVGVYKTGLLNQQLTIRYMFSLLYIWGGVGALLGFIPGTIEFDVPWTFPATEIITFP